jgi:hypothetical protein
MAGLDKPTATDPRPLITAWSSVSSSLQNNFQACNISTVGATTTCTAANMGLQYMSNEIAGCMASAGFQDAGGNSGNLPTFCTTMVGALAHQHVTQLLVSMSPIVAHRPLKEGDDMTTERLFINAFLLFFVGGMAIVVGIPLFGQIIPSLLKRYRISREKNKEQQNKRDKVD